MMYNHFHKAVKLFYSNANFITGKNSGSASAESMITCSLFLSWMPQNPHITGYNNVDNSFAAVLYLHSEIDGEMVELV